MREYFFKSIQRNKINGSALVMALFASIGLAALGLVIMNSAKIKQSITQRQMADADVDQAMLKINSILLDPKHCNATFYGRPTAGVNQIPDIKTCISGSCAGAGSSGTAIRVLTAAVLATFSTTKEHWDSDSTHTGLSSKVRVKEASYSISPLQTHVAGGGAPGMLNLSIKFEKNIGFNGTTNNNSSDYKTSVIVKDFQIPVITATWSPGSITQSSTILGCPRSPNSTMP